MTTTAAVRTAAEFDALPEGATILTVEVRDREHGHYVRNLWKKFGSGWVSLDPGDRNNGEDLQPSGYLENLLTGFGRKNVHPGVALVLVPGEVMSVEEAADLPRHTVIVAGEFDEWMSELFTSAGGGKWNYMDPADPYDGDYPTGSEGLEAFGGPLCVLYRPGDEDIYL